MTNTFIISDLHLGHRNIIKYEADTRGQFSSIDEHDGEIIKRWNKTVNPTDCVWILGDLVMNKRALPKVGALNGRKRLVMGNHDVFAEGVLDHHVQRLFGCVTKNFQDIRTILTHIPVHTSQVDHRFQFNIHGHLHGHIIPDLRYVNVSMEHWDLTPVPFDVIHDELKERKKIIDNFGRNERNNILQSYNYFKQKSLPEKAMENIERIKSWTV